MQDDRALIGRILFVTVWVPIQIVLSLFFATGGIMLLLLLGLVLGPFVGLFMLVRHLGIKARRVSGTGR